MLLYLFIQNFNIDDKKIALDDDMMTDFADFGDLKAKV